MFDLDNLKASIKNRLTHLEPDSYSELIPTKEKSKYIYEANLLLNNDFKFDRRWDMERCNKIYHLNTIDFEKINNDDPEWNFMFNRMDWLDYLCLAGIITKEDKYFEKIKEYIFTWIDQHPSIKSQNSTRTLDTGIRLINWLNCIIYLSWFNALSDFELETIAKSMEKQILYLKSNYLPKYKLSNWGSIQVCAILVVLPYIHNNVDHDEIYIWAKNELKSQLNLQVLDDGMNWEQSPMYHVELLLALQHLVLFENNVLNKEVLNTIKKMSFALQLIVTPERLLPNFGDSDQVSAKDILANSAYILHDQELNYFGEFSYENILYTGSNIIKLKEIKKTLPQKLNFLGSASGNYSFRSSWKKDANYMFFNNGSMGSGHAHADNLHLSIYGKGSPLFVDSGRYTYREDHPMRVLLKSAKAHNIVQIDNLELAKPNSSWDYDSYYKVLPTYYNSKKNIHYIEGSVLGKYPLEIWTRKIVMLEEGLWIISDEVSIQGNHEFNQIWHIHPQASYENNTLTVLDNTWNLSYSGSAKVEDFPYSSKYNELQTGKMLTLSKPFSDNISFTTTIANSNLTVKKIPILQNLNTPVNDNIAEGWKITTSEHEYCIAIFHQEVFTGKKVFSLDGVPFHHQAFATIDQQPLALKN